jgi:hypothetical protein
MYRLVAVAEGALCGPAQRWYTRFETGSGSRIVSVMAEEIRESLEGTAGDFAQVIESARAMVGEQFQIAERLDRKARYQAATAGAFFAVVQAVAINAITGAGLTKSWIVTLAAVAVPAGLMTIASVLAAADAWRTQIEKDLPIPDLRAMVDGIALGDENAPRELAHHYLNLAEKRRAGNAARLPRVKKAAAAALISIGLTGLELIMVFIALTQHG